MLHDEFQPIDLKAFVCRYWPGTKRWNQKEKSKQTSQTSFTPTQTGIMGDLTKTYSPYVGKGTIGGLSDLEESSLNMLRSANVWDPLSQAGTGLLTGTTGAQKISPQGALDAYKSNVSDPFWNEWEQTGKARRAETLSGPSYLSRGKNIIANEERDYEKALGEGRAKWMWDAEAANRSIDEAKAGRSLSALNAVPASQLAWTSGISSMGRQAQQLLNQITDPQVLQVLDALLNASPAGMTTERGVSAPSEFEQWKNWADVGARVAMTAAGAGALDFGGVKPYKELGSYASPYN